MWAVASGGAAAAEPMLARAGAIPTGRGWLFEPKLDGLPAPDVHARRALPRSWSARLEYDRAVA